MTAGSPQPGAEYFTAPRQVNQRRYEALRAFFVDGLTHAQAGERFGYTRWAIVNLVRARDVAAVLMEPALTNIGIVLPEPGTWARCAASAASTAPS